MFLYFLFLSSSNSLLPESILWSYAIQLTGALRVIHAAGLSCRCLDASKVIITNRSRVRLSGVCIFDVILYDHSPANRLQLTSHYQVGRTKLRENVVIYLFIFLIMFTFIFGFGLLARRFVRIRKTSTSIGMRFADCDSKRKFTNILRSDGQNVFYRYSKFDSVSIRSTRVSSRPAKQSIGPLP